MSDKRYDILEDMNKNMHSRLTAAVAAVKELPEAAQEALVEEFFDRVASFADSVLSPEQRDEVARRLALPPRTVPASHIDAIFDRYLQSA